MGVAVCTARPSAVHDKAPVQHVRLSPPPVNDAAPVPNSPHEDVCGSGDARTAKKRRNTMLVSALPSTTVHRRRSVRTPEEHSTIAYESITNDSVRERSSLGSSASSIVVINLDTGAREDIEEEEEVYFDADENTMGEAPEVNVTKAAASVREASSTAQEEERIKAVSTPRHILPQTPQRASPTTPRAVPATGAGSVPPLSLPSSEPRPLPLAACVSPRLSISDIQTLVGPLDLYEQRFGHLYQTGRSPFVVEHARTRGTVGEPLPQPDPSQPRQPCGRPHTQVKLVGAMYVARRVPSPHWKRVKALDGVKLTQHTSARGKWKKRIPREEGPST